MKKKIVSIYSSSFIFEKSNLWKVFNKSNFNIKFNFFNNFQKINLEKNIDYLIIIILFEDIYNGNQSFKSILKDIEKECIKLSKKNDFKILFFFSNWYKENLLNTSKNYYEKEKSTLFFNNFFLKNITKIHNCYIFDLDNYFGEVGFLNVFDSRNWYLLKSRLSIEGIKILINFIDRTLLNFEMSKRKILVLDCDNTLWGGVIGEDGMSNIILGTDGTGQIYKDIQKEIINIYKKGILIALISKNNQEDVLKVFKKHSEMLLKLKHITSYKINWKNKYQNINEISKELDLHISNFAFLDDNPIEREQMKSSVPLVKTLEPPKELYKWPLFIRDLDIFAISHLLENDKKRNNQYKSRMKFIIDKENEKDDLNFLKKIRLTPKILKINDNYIQRAIQLSQRTNQFTVLKNEYNNQSLQNIIKNNKEIFYLLKLKDKYGDHGIVGLFHIIEIQKGEYQLYNFLLSCRILGRYIEYWLINEIKNILIKKSFNFLLIKPNNTKRNKIALRFINSLDLLFDKKEKAFILNKKTKIKNLGIYKIGKN
jgi:FkbH-like protein